MRGKLVGGQLTYAPRIATYNGIRYNPAPDWVLEALGYKTIVYTNPPECEEDYHVESYWMETDTEIRQAWRQVADEPSVIVARCKAELEHYDYIGVKIAMGVATREQYSVEIAHTETIREKIRQYENEV